MTKADLVEQIAEATGLTKKDTAVVVDGFLEAVKQALARESNIEIRGFGSFKVKRRKARKARNPRTGDAVYVPGRLVPTFKPSKELKELVMEESPATVAPRHTARRSGRRFADDPVVSLLKTVRP